MHNQKEFKNEIARLSTGELTSELLDLIFDKDKETNKRVRQMKIGAISTELANREGDCKKVIYVSRK